MKRNIFEPASTYHGLDVYSVNRCRSYHYISFLAMDNVVKSSNYPSHQANAIWHSHLELFLLRSMIFILDPKSYKLELLGELVV